MKSFRTALILLLVGAITSLSAVSAQAKGTHTKSSGSNNPIVIKCEHDGYQLPGHYTLAQLRAAYASIPATTQSYSTCGQVIDNKINALISNKHVHGGGSGGGFPWIVVVIIVIVLAGGGGAFWSYRRSQAASEPPRD